MITTHKLPELGFSIFLRHGNYHKYILSYDKIYNIIYDQ